MKILFGSMFGILGVIFLLLAFIFLPVAAGIYYFGQYSTRDWVTVQGTVTGLKESETVGSDRSQTPYIGYCPTVRYQTAAGDEIEEDLNECATPPDYATGDSVELNYNPSNPHDVQIKGGFKARFFVILEAVFGFLGGLFCIGGISLVVAAIAAATWRTKSPSAIG